MPVEYPINDPEHLTDALDSYGQSFTPKEVERELKKAGRRTKRKFGRNIEDRLWKKQEKQTEFELTFPGVEVFERLVLDDEVVDEGKYNVQNGIVKVTDSKLKEELKSRRNYVLRAVYTPTDYKDFELDYAIHQVLKRRVSNTNDDVANQKVGPSRRDLEKMEKEINRLAASASDPTSGEHAKNINRERRIL